MSIENILSLIGLSSIVSVIITFVFDHIKTRLNLKYEKLFLEKESRYRSMLVFMSVVLDEENLKHIDSTYKPKGNDIKKYYLNEVILHKKFFQLFAEDCVIKSVEKFIDNPNEETYESVALSMRKDLWSKK